MPPKRRRSYVATTPRRAFRRLSYASPQVHTDHRTGRTVARRASSVSGFRRGSSRTPARRVGRPVGRRRVPSRRFKRRRIKRSRKSGISQTAFNKKLMMANGRRYTLSRHLQCEWQCTLTTAVDVALAASQIEPAATYMWPRQVGMALNSWFVAPEYAQDWVNIMTATVGSSWFTTPNNDSIFSDRVRLGWRARYSLTNQNNHPVRYTAWLCKWRRDVPWYNNSGQAYDFENIMNIAGNYQAHILQPSNAPVSDDALNASLSYASVNIFNLPPIKDLIKVVKRTNFKLDMGQERAFICSRKSRQLNLRKLYPPLKLQVPAGTQPNSAYAWEKNDAFMLFRVWSDPCDYDDGTTVPANALSSRTVPVTLMSYDIKYFTHSFGTLASNQHVVLPAYGMFQVPVSTKLQVMTDSDEKVVPEAAAI